MQLLRMFSTGKYKGTRNYLKTQRKYEIIRTVLYFAISLSLFAAGYITTKTRLNLLTLVAGHSASYFPFIEPHFSGYL